jgi:hypothetical protein
MSIATALETNLGGISGFGGFMLRIIRHSNAGLVLDTDTYPNSLSGSVFVNGAAIQQLRELSRAL